jgi:hypothetical protein
MPQAVWCIGVPAESASGGTQEAVAGSSRDLRPCAEGARGAYGALHAEAQR